MVKPGFVLLILFCYVCNGEEVHCSRYHYEEQTLAKVLKLEHQLEQLTAEVHVLRANQESLPTFPIRKNATQACCPTGWIRFGDSCYLFVERTLSYYDARLNCRTLDAQLVHISSAMENDFIVSHLKTFKQQYHWMSLTDIETEGTFKWENGDEVTFSDWNSGQPDNGSGREDCAHFHEGYGYRWNDAVCSSLMASICRISS